MLDSKVTKNGAVLESRIKRIAILFSGNGSNLEGVY